MSNNNTVQSSSRSSLDDDDRMESSSSSSNVNKNNVSSSDDSDDNDNNNDHQFIDDDDFLPTSVARRKNKRSNTTPAPVLDNIRRRYSKTPFIAICIVGIFVTAAVIRGYNRNKSQENAQAMTQNAGALRTAHKEHHYTNPFEASASGDGKQHAVKVINEKSSTGHVQSHGGWNEQDEDDNDKDWSCRTDFPNEQAWTTWMNHVSRIGPQSACVRELKHPCHCRQPLDPIPRASELWKQCVKRNQDLITQEQEVANNNNNNNPQQAQDQQQQQELDVLMLGDSIIEYWQGTKMGVTMPSLQATHQVYLDLFRRNTNNINNNANNNDINNNEYVNTAPVHGLALGIAGDTCPQLLYRLQHGELMTSSPTSLQPHVYWILIGINDYLSNACNAHVIAACNIKVVEYIQQHSNVKNATVVINSMLPMIHSHAAWRELSQINQQLECYAEHHEHVYFFNAYEYFLSTTTTVSTTTTTNNAEATTPSTTVINTTLLQPDGLHPSTLGYQVWGNAIVEYVQELKHLKKISGGASSNNEIGGGGGGNGRAGGGGP